MSLKNGDLKNTVLPIISIDEFEPKAGDEKNVIVVAFYLQDEDPADDLNTFIQRGFVDTLDVEVSPSTDEEGRYLVFVEMARDETFPRKFKALVEDVENLTGKQDWKIKTYYSGDTEFNIDDPVLDSYMILNPEEYVSKDEFKMKEIEEGINEFFKNSLMANLTINGNIVTIAHNRDRIITEVVDVGNYDVVFDRNFLKDSAFILEGISYEAKVLESILGNCKVLPIEGYLCLIKDNKVMLLRETQFI